MSHRRPNRIWPVAFVVLAAIALAPATSHAYPRSLRCEYVEAGPPGPAGNVLEIAGNDNAQVRRDGELVLVGTSAANGPRQFEEIDCGAQPTVTNLDRIAYRGEPVPGNVEHQFLLDERGGPLAPGATPEPVDPEIEVEVILPAQREARPRVQLLAGDERDGIRLQAVSGVTEVSLEPWPYLRGFTPDADLSVNAPRRTLELKVHAGGGGDVLDARGLDRHRELVRSVLLAGDDGKDALLGTLAGDVLEGGSGPDRLFGRDGRDFLYPSAGEDSVSGGPGADFIAARLGGADKIGCGPGFDEAQADRVDELVDGTCEVVRGPAR